MSAPVATSAAASYAVLDAAYRAATAETAIAVASGLLFRWTSVSASDLALTSGAWLDDSVGVVLDGQRRATDLANRYTLAVRRLAVPGAPPFTPPPMRPPNEEQVRKSLEFVAIKETARELYRVESVRAGAPSEAEEQESAERSLRGRQDQLMREAIRRAAGTAVRHVTSAGHGQLIDNVQADPQATGWARTTKAGCCYFCAMLASRDYVYKQDSFEESNAQFEGIGEQKVHDSCGCGLRPLYSDDDPKPDRMEALEKLWEDEAAQFSGPEAVRAFRRAYEASELATPVR